MASKHEEKPLVSLWYRLANGTTAASLRDGSNVAVTYQETKKKKEKGEQMKSYRPYVPTLVARLRLKAEASRLAAQQSQPATRNPMRTGEIREQGKKINVDLWMLRQVPINAGLYQEWLDLAEAADAAADACVALETVTSGPVATHQQRVKALEMLAEGVCMLRIAHQSASTKIFGSKGGGMDPDQQRIFEHTSHVAKKWHVRLPFMKMEDRANPEDAAELRQDITKFLDESRQEWGVDNFHAVVSRRMAWASGHISGGGASCS